MKIFLTEINAYGTTFAGPNIIAKTIERAEQAATQNGLVVVGVLDSIYIDNSDSEHMNRVELTPLPVNNTHHNLRRLQRIQHDTEVTKVV
jgi:hypothetical protein